ncbi:MAG: hypothetical protein K2W33_07250, partial [Burkholderiales bacterium]|nr:hypothetical protein [Burkholderiales bacterium]
ADTGAAVAMVAVLAHVYCVWLVFRRLQHARRNEWPQFEATDHLQHKVGAVVLLGVLAAAAMGVALAWVRSGAQPDVVTHLLAMFKSRMA